jgi:hypothetical protein
MSSKYKYMGNNKLYVTSFYNRDTENLNQTEISPWHKIHFLRVHNEKAEVCIITEPL